MYIEDKLLEILNQYFKNVFIKYTDINVYMPLCDDDKNFTRKFEKQYPEFGISNYGTSLEGISSISLLNTVVATLTNGKRLIFNIDDDTNRIISVDIKQF